MQHQHDGRIFGTLVEVVDTPLPPSIDFLSHHEIVGDVSVFGTALHVHLVDQHDPVPTIREILDARDIEVAAAREIPAGLEDAFLYLTRKTTPPLSTEAT